MSLSPSPFTTPTFSTTPPQAPTGEIITATFLGAASWLLIREPGGPENTENIQSDELTKRIRLGQYELIHGGSSENKKESTRKQKEQKQIEQREKREAQEELEAEYAEEIEELQLELNISDEDMKRIKDKLLTPRIRTCEHASGKTFTVHVDPLGRSTVMSAIVTDAIRSDFKKSRECEEERLQMKKAEKEETKAAKAAKGLSLSDGNFEIC